MDSYLVSCCNKIRNRRSAVAKMSRGEENEREVGTLATVPAAMSSFPVPYRHFRQGQKGSAVDLVLVLLAGGCPSTRVTEHRHSLAVCVRPRGQGARATARARLIDKSNVGRFDCAPSACMHFPQAVRGGWQRRRREAGGTERAGRVLHSLACAGCDVEHQQQQQQQHIDLELP